MVTSTPFQGARRAPLGAAASEDAAPRDALPAASGAVGTRWTLFAAAALSGLLLWLAFPPVNAWPLAWLAPLGWLWLIQRPSDASGWFHFQVWSAGFLHWLALAHYIPLPHPALWAGWIALAAYLACYPALFVGLTRVATRRSRMPLALAAPLVWIGLELARGHVFTGFSMSLLGHTQLPWLGLAQSADWGGAYAVSFLVVLPGAALVQSLEAWCAAKRSAPRGSEAGGGIETRRRAMPLGRAMAIAWPLAASALALAAAAGYGAFRLAETPPAAQGASAAPPLRAALVQTSVDTEFGAGVEYIRQGHDQAVELTREAAALWPPVDVVLWPESMYMDVRAFDVLFAPDAPLPAELRGQVSPEAYHQRLRELALEYELKARALASLLKSGPPRAPANDAGEGDPPRGAAAIVGDESTVYDGAAPRRYNAAIFINPEGVIAGRYYKMHRVVFGEYIPPGDWLPFIYRFTPMPSGLAAGESPQTFLVEGIRLAPSICFESTVPHLVRGQVLALRARGEEPDVLVNLTNDGWFRGTAVLDMHLACTRFRAIEHRKPTLVAANTGFSAVIDSRGKLVTVGPRRRTALVVGEARPDGRRTLYQTWGDLPAGLGLGLCLVCVFVGMRDKIRRRPANC